VLPKVLKNPTGPPPLQRESVWPKLLLALVLLYLFLIGITCLGGGIKALGKGVMDVYFASDMNPFLALMVGILATTLVQSSSVSTSIIVGLVGASQISVAAAVPMVMGANIGTTVTNTIASLAHSTHDNEFRRAFAAATCHDFFNYLSVLVLLPIELITRAIFGRGVLETIAHVGADLTMGAQGGNFKSPLKASFKAGKAVVEGGLEAVGFDDRALHIALAISGGVIILLTLTLIVKVMRDLVTSRLERYVNRVLGSGGLVAIIVGIVLTVMAQSSSITTSVMVPLAGAGLVTLQQIYPITLGANIGTTVTALIASMAVTGEAAMAARQVAIVHLAFNLAGIMIWFVPQTMRKVPLAAATWMAEIGAKSKRNAIMYVFGAFYVVPVLIFIIAEAF
jgi:solute carrier family 34 (sodium-dependent phosphate cotransporter)